jgi:DNA-binding NarL/FixJ family response regulator
MLSQLIQVVIVDDHDRFRTGLMSTLNAENDLKVVGEGASAADAIELARVLNPDIIVLDLDMPGNGLHAAEVISKLHPTIKIVMLTASTDEHDIQTAQENGATGYIVKGITARSLITTLRNIFDGAQSWPALAVGAPRTSPRLASGT